ncbi:MAG: hypothetical protein WBB16_03415 [Aestuariivirga sp.]
MTIGINVQPLIPAGLPRKAFQERLQTDIETATAKLVAEGRETVRIKNKFSTPA